MLAVPPQDEAPVADSKHAAPERVQAAEPRAELEPQGQAQEPVSVRYASWTGSALSVAGAGPQPDESRLALVRVASAPQAAAVSQTRFHLQQAQIAPAATQAPGSRSPAADGRAAPEARRANPHC